MQEITSVELKEFSSKLLNIVGKYYQRTASREETVLAVEENLKSFCIENNIKYMEGKEKICNN